MLPFNHLIAAQRRYQRELMQKANVVGVAVGYKESHGIITDELALVALVEAKVPLAALSAEDMIPKELDGARTDVYEVGYLQALQASPRDRFRPTIPGGVSIAHPLVGAGTLGVLVRDRSTGQPLLLSNNHVIAASNDALIGDPVLQPGSLDGGQNPGDIVARLERYIPLHYQGEPPPATPPPTTPEPPLPPDDPTQPPTTPPPTTPPPRSGCDVVDVVVRFGNLLAELNGSQKRIQATVAEEVVVAAQQTADNLLDAAVARPLDPAMFSEEIRHIGRITGTTTPTLGTRVRKAGRTTDYTEGVITLVNATVNVSYRTRAGTKTARFTGQVITQVMSQPGDSGSLVVEVGTQNAVGLLFAGSSVSTIFTPIDVVLDRLGLAIW